MTTQEALMEIAEAYLTPFDDRSGRQVKLSRGGICYALYVLGKNTGPLIFYVANYNGDFMSFFTPIRTSILFRDDFDTYRGMFCLLLATMPENDFKEILREA